MMNMNQRDEHDQHDQHDEYYKRMFGVEDRVPNKKTLHVDAGGEGGGTQKTEGTCLGNLRECVVAELWWVLSDC